MNRYFVSVGVSLALLGVAVISPMLSHDPSAAASTSTTTSSASLADHPVNEDGAPIFVGYATPFLEDLANQISDAMINREADFAGAYYTTNYSHLDVYYKNSAVLEEPFFKEIQKKGNGQVRFIKVNYSTADLDKVIDKLAQKFANMKLESSLSVFGPENRIQIDLPESLNNQELATVKNMMNQSLGYRSTNTDEAAPIFKINLTENLTLTPEARTKLQ